MFDFFLAFSVNVAIVSLLLVVIKGAGVVDLNLRWAFASTALLVGYFLALATRNDLIPVTIIFPGASYNWGGKILAIALWVAVLLLLIRLKPDFRAGDAGFTLKQSPASTKPAMFALGLFVLLQVLLVHLMGGDGEYNTEDLLFQALIPGLDEEPMYRGVLLYSLSLAVPSKRVSVVGSPINIAGLLLVVFFGLVHGVGYSSGEWHLSPYRILLTGLYGFILLWLRERTGSLLFPIVAHNTINVVGLFTVDF